MMENKSGKEISENAMLLRWFVVGLLAFGFMMGVFTLYSKLVANAKVEELKYAQYQKPNYGGSLRSLDKKDPLDKAKCLLALDKLQASKEALTNVLATTSNKDTIHQAHFYLAHVYINIGAIDKAKHELSLCTQSTSLHQILDMDGQ